MESSSSERTCPSCYKTVEAGLHGMKLECNHWVHTKCLDKKEPNFEKCNMCLSSSSSPSSSSFSPYDHDAIDGRDYISNPVSSASWVYKAFVKEPFTWLREHKKLEWIMNEKKYGLQKLLQAGVCIEDFLQNGYTWDNLKIYKGFQERLVPTLKALKCNAEHFREYKNDFKLTGRQLVEDFGLYFPKGGKPMQCMGGKNQKSWIASELVDLGFEIKDLFGADMQYIEQYAALQPTDEDEIKLKVEDKDIDALPSIVKQVERAKEILNPQAIQKSIVYKEEMPKREEEVISILQVDLPPPPRRIHGLRK
jgi:hypothetical protein